MSRQRTNERARKLASAGLFGAFAPLLLAACDGSGDDVGGSSSGAAPSGAGHAGGAGAGSGPSGAGAGGAAGVAGGGASSPGGAGGTAARDPSSLSPRLTRYHRGTESDRALWVELDAVEGLLPYASSRDYLTTLLGRVLDKPDGIVFDEDETLAGR